MAAALCGLQASRTYLFSRAQTFVCHFLSNLFKTDGGMAQTGEEQA